MYGGNPFRRQKRSKSNSHPEFAIRPDTTLDLLRAASKKLKDLRTTTNNHNNNASRSKSTPPRVFYRDPGQQHPEPFLIPSELDTHRYLSSDSDSPTKNGYHSSPENRSFHQLQFGGDDDIGSCSIRSAGGSCNSCNSCNSEDPPNISQQNRSPAISLSTVAHDSPYRSDLSSSCQLPIFNTPPAQENSIPRASTSTSNSTFSLSSSSSTATSPYFHPQQQFQTGVPLNTLTILLCDPTGGRAVLRAKAHPERVGVDKWELCDMFSLHPSGGANDLSVEKIDAIFLCAHAEADAHGPESLEVVISQYHFHHNHNHNHNNSTTPLFVVMVETQPQLIRSPGRSERMTTLARSVHARDVLHVSIPYGDTRVATVASSGTLESHGVLETVSLSLVEFHSPAKKSRKHTPFNSISGGLLRGLLFRNGGGQ